MVHRAQRRFVTRTRSDLLGQVILHEINRKGCDGNYGHTVGHHAESAVGGIPEGVPAGSGIGAGPDRAACQNVVMPAGSRIGPFQEGAFTVTGICEGIR